MAGPEPLLSPVRWPGLVAAGLGVVYVLGITFQYPLSVSPDGVSYLELAAQLLEGMGLRTYDEAGNLQLVTHWPPFYPFCVAGLGLLLGIEPLSAARILAALCLGISLFVLDRILVRLGPSTAVRCLCLALLFTSLPFVVFTKALSDGLFLTLLLILTLLLMRWQEAPRSGWLLIAGGLAGLMFLTRYAAVGFVVGAGLFLLTRPVPFGKRLGQALTFGIPAVLFASAWVIYTVLEAGGPANRSLAFHFISWQHVVVLVKTGLLWLYPAWQYMGFFILALLVGLGILVNRDHPRFGLDWAAAPFRLFAWLSGTYLAFLGLSITFIDFHTPLNYRILAPVFPFFVFFSLPFWQSAFSADRARRLAIAILVLVGLSYLWAFAERSEQHFQHGHYYTSESWLKSPTLAYLDRIAPDRRVYTNGPDPVRLLRKRHQSILRLPLEIEATSQRENPDFERDMENMHEELRSGRAILIFFEAIYRPYFPDATDLRTRFADIPVHRFGDGFAMERVAPD